MININEFLETYKVEADESELSLLLSVSEDIVNAAIMNRSIDKLSERQKQLYVKAVYAECYYIYSNGGMDFLSEDNAVGSISLGNYSYGNTQSSNSNKKRIATDLCPLALMYLGETGLMYRGVLL